MKTIYSYLICFIFLSGCTHETIVQPTNNNTVVITVGNTPVKSDTVCFNSEVLPLFTTYCSSAGCHDAISHKEGVNLTTFTLIRKGITPFKPSSSKYYTIIGNGMPPRGSPQMTTTQLNTIVKWINQGALNTNCINSCDTTMFTYSNPIQTLLTNNCNGCHGIKPGSGNVYLGDYASAKAYISANQVSFLNSINHSPTVIASKRMPPSNKMVDCQIGQFSKWITKGFPQ